MTNRIQISQSTAQLLLEAGIAPATPDANGRRPLDVAIRRRNLPLVLLLLQKGVQPSRMNVNAIGGLVETDRYRGRYEAEREQLQNLLRFYEK